MTWQLTRSRFFEHYEPFIPGLFDYNTTPTRFYEQSPLLFWCIVATGARRYTEDPILFERVVRQILQIALTSLFSLSNSIPTIEAVLILCSWPMPVNTMFKDATHALAGVAMQLAVQNGLHIFGREQDFVRQSIDEARSEVALRFRLWIHCVIIFQRYGTLRRFGDMVNLTRDSSNLTAGFPYRTVPESSNSDFNLALQNSLPPSMTYRFRLHKVQIDAIQAITQSTNLVQPDCGAPLNSLIELFDSQVRALVPDETAKIGTRTIKFHFV